MGFYLLHQVSFWALIAYAQRTAGRNRPRYSNSLRSVNYLALGVNGFFILLHLVQTHLWYDGLAQDVSIWSALGSVVVMLVWVLLMENPRRGLFFGKKIGFPRRLTEVARRYHGYYFAWAIIYTFWYHPMEATGGHLIGFLYMFLPMLQGSLLFTRAHVNRRWWTLAAERGRWRCWPTAPWWRSCRGRACGRCSRRSNGGRSTRSPLTEYLRVRAASGFVRERLARQVGRSRADASSRGPQSPSIRPSQGLARPRWLRVGLNPAAVLPRRPQSAAARPDSVRASQALQQRPNMLRKIAARAADWKAGSPPTASSTWSVAQREARHQNARFLILPAISFHRALRGTMAGLPLRLPSSCCWRHFVQSDISFNASPATSYRRGATGPTSDRPKAAVHRTHALLLRKTSGCYPLRRDFRRRLCAHS